jgi:hypothetical protein
MPLKLFTMEGRDTFSKLQQIRKTANNLLPAVRASYTKFIRNLSGIADITSRV